MIYQNKVSPAVVVDGHFHARAFAERAVPFTLPTHTEPGLNLAVGVHSIF